MVREPVVLESGDLDHIEDVLETLAEGYHILSPDEAKQQQYQAMLERLQETRPDMDTAEDTTDA